MSIILNHVIYSYDVDTVREIRAVDDVSIKIEDGEFLAIVGKTGSGKSTLLQLMNGLLKAGRGQVLCDGFDIYDKDYDLKTLRTRVGLVFQYPEHQLFESDVFTDVCFGPKNMNLPGGEEEIRNRAYEALDLVHFPEENYSISPFELSGGQKRKAAIAGILAMRPNTLILDEPTAGLDPAGRDEILGLLKELNETRKITIILVSHSMDDAAQYAKRIIVMNKGKKVLDDTPQKVFANESFLESIGLDIPECCKIMNELREAGIPVRGDAMTGDEVVSAIIRAVGK